MTSGTAWDASRRPRSSPAVRYDGLAPRANSEAIASRIPNAELRCYEGGHLFVYQDPQAMPDITAFLQKVSPMPSADVPST